MATAFVISGRAVEGAIVCGPVPGMSNVTAAGPSLSFAAVMAARASGAGCIIVAGLSIDESRLEICRRVGAHFTIAVEKEDLVERVREITGGEGADVVINITGAGTNTAEQSLACVAKVATIVLSDAGDETIALKSFGRRELTIKSSNGHSYASVEAAISMIASGDYPIAELTAPPFTLDQASEAIDAVEGLVDRSITFATIVPRLSK